jgi:ribose 5-phosphate isomerase A
MRTLVSEDVEKFKRAAGEAAVDRYVHDGMCVGLGTGSTALWAIRRVGALVAEGAAIEAVATSRVTEDLCHVLRIPLIGFLEREIDVAIDGADEVAPDFALTKGGGGALFREKCVALAALRFIVIIDESKLVPALGAFPTPVEVVPYAAPWVEREIHRAFPHATIAQRGGTTPLVTDNGNTMLDVHFGTIDNPGALDAQMKAIHGVVATGLFTDVAHDVIVAGTNGITTLTRQTRAL